MRKPKQPDLFPPESALEKITARGDEEFNAVLDRHYAGEFRIEIQEVGKTNGEWVFTVRKLPQPAAAA